MVHGQMPPIPQASQGEGLVIRGTLDREEGAKQSIWPEVPIPASSFTFSVASTTLSPSKPQFAPCKNGHSVVLTTFLELLGEFHSMRSGG